MEAFVKLGFPREKIVNIVADFGNCVAASIPMTLAIANEQGRLKRGDRVLIGGTGAGLSSRLPYCSGSDILGFY